MTEVNGRELTIELLEEARRIIDKNSQWYEDNRSRIMKEELDKLLEKHPELLDHILPS